MNEELLNKIIAAAYKDAGLIDRIKIYFLAKKEPEVKKIFDEYRATASTIKNFPLERIPDSIVNSLKFETDRKKPLVLKPAYIFAVSIVAVTITIAVILFQIKKDEPVYSQAEIEFAEEQVKTSLAIVNKIFKKTENLIQEEILPKRVGKPIHKSLTIINNVLTGG
ncbi:MAG: hypothetical protein EHM47_06855 [Ignavibacteriales bacterium]|nr:MAG: hypothetical protein EHM47_06855 [Ignavibacteriales bacterium]